MTLTPAETGDADSRDNTDPPDIPQLQLTNTLQTTLTPAGMGVYHYQI